MEKEKKIVKYIGVFAVGYIVGGLIFALYTLSTIKSETPIKVTYEIEVDGCVNDTTWVYHVNGKVYDL